MNQYKINLFFPEMSETIPVVITADSFEKVMGKVWANADTKILVKDGGPDEHPDVVSAVYVETLRLAKDELDRIYTYIFARGSADGNISKTVHFPDGMEMDISACGEMDGPGWTEAVLFQNGSECGYSEVEEKYEGVWAVPHDSILYVTVVVPEVSPWLSPNIVTIHGSCLESMTQVIAHQTNCKGVMGAGVAKAIGNRYPEIMPKYQAACQSGNMLGKCQFIETKDRRFIANLFGQDGFGIGRQTDYDALESALRSLVSQMYERGFISVAMPYNLGCGLAGGDWTIVLEKLKKVFAGTHFRLELWKLIP